MKKQLRGIFVLLAFASSCFIPSCSSDDMKTAGIIAAVLVSAGLIMQIVPNLGNQEADSGSTSSGSGYNGSSSNSGGYGNGGSTTCSRCQGEGKCLEGMDSSGQPAYLNCSWCGGDGKI